jgi:ribosomal protein S18 acetylase RimI-like enzyme
MPQQYQVRTDASGTGVVRYIEGVRDGRPWADRLEVIGPRPVELILSDLRGWAVSAPVEVSEQLIERGARLLRHAHTMSCDLTSTPLGGAEADAPEGFRFVPCDRPAEEVLAAWRAAYPPGHPDHHPRGDAEALRDELAPLLGGQLLGPVLPCGGLAVGGDDEVVAGVVVTDWDGTAWIAEVFRHPVDAPRGLGSRLLRRTQARAAADGLPALSLAVSHANPARRVYERLGFVVTETSMTVIVDP